MVSTSSCLLSAGLSREEMEKAQKGTYCPAIQGAPEITSLYNNTPVFDYVRSLLGPRAPPIYAGQIALRWPGQLCTDKRNFVPTVACFSACINSLAVVVFFVAH